MFLHKEDHAQFHKAFLKIKQNIENLLLKYNISGGAF